MIFEDWFYETEGFGFRAERFYNDLNFVWSAPNAYDLDGTGAEHFVKWLEAAYKAGYEHRNIELMDEGK